LITEDQKKIADTLRAFLQDQEFVLQQSMLFDSIISGKKLFI
jgi:hypothetical protein